MTVRVLVVALAFVCGCGIPSAGGRGPDSGAGLDARADLQAVGLDARAELDAAPPGDDASAVDGGAPPGDASADDAAPPGDDVSAVDAAVLDAGAVGPDASAFDAAVLDAGAVEPDAPALDAAALDAGAVEPDAPALDAALDAGSVGADAHASALLDAGAAAADAGAGDGAVVDFSRWRWRPMPPSGVARRAPAVAWTGRELVVHGPAPQGGALGQRFDSARSAWAPVSTLGQPYPQLTGYALWTGSAVLVWGGREGVVSHRSSNRGALYDPANDTWRATSLNGAPLSRSSPAAIWTGAEMIVWGGAHHPNGAVSSDLVPLGDGARYDPAGDRWTSTSTVGSPPPTGWPGHAVWTGAEMLLPELPAPMRYAPASDTWRPMSAAGRPALAPAHPSPPATGVWTGAELFVWNGTEGARYDPRGDTWTRTSTAGAPPAGEMVWTGTHALVVSSTAAGAYDPAADRWTPIDYGGAQYEVQRVFWTGREAIMYGHRWSTRDIGFILAPP